MELSQISQEKQESSMLNSILTFFVPSSDIFSYVAEYTSFQNMELIVKSSNRSLFGKLDYMSLHRLASKK